MTEDVNVVVYSSNPVTRRRVIDAVGCRPDRSVGTLRYTEIATAPALIAHLDAQRCDLVVLDGEATPAGGLGIARQLRDELGVCPPIVVLVARDADRWLARWSTADAAVTWPPDPMGMSEVLVSVLSRRRRSVRVG